jgi:hypothetical protein
MITIEILRDLAPKKTRSLITQDLVDKVNGWNEDPKLLGAFKDNVLTYIGVLKTGKYRIEEYMNAVRFVSYKLIGHSDIDAYAITFPDRYQRLIDEGTKRNDIAPYVSIYRKTQLVVKIFEQSIVPSHVLNAPMHQEALNTLADIALNGRSEVARVSACTSILANTKPPEAAKVELDISIDKGSVIDDYESAMNAMVQQQLDLIEKGGDLKAIANASIKRPEEVIEAELDG